MLILIAVILFALVGVWTVYPLFLRKTVISEREAAVIDDEIEKDVDELRKQS